MLPFPSPFFLSSRLPRKKTEQERRETMEERKPQRSSKKRKADELNDKVTKTDSKALLKKIKKDAKKHEKSDDDDEAPQLTTIKRGDVPEGFRVRPSAIKNKMKREEMYHKHKSLKKKLKTLQRRKRQKEREALGDKVTLPFSFAKLEATHTQNRRPQSRNQEQLKIRENLMRQLSNPMTRRL